MRLLILGAGGYGRTVADTAAQTGRFEQISFLDDQWNPQAERFGEILGPLDTYLLYSDPETEMIPAFGSNQLRLEWLDRLSAAGLPVATIIHPTAYVSPTAEIEEGNVILAGAIVNTDVEVRRGCIINCGAIIDHECIIGEGVHVCLGAVVKGDNCLPDLLKVEAGEVIPVGKYPKSEWL